MATAASKSNGQRSAWADAWAFMGSLQLFIPLIIILTLGVALATMVDPQGATKWAEASSGRMALARVLGLADPFHAFWLQALLALLATNLVACVTRRFPALPRFSRLLGRPLADPPAPPPPAQHHLLAPLPVAEASALLRTHGYRAQEFVRSNGDRLLYAERGIWGTMGPWITHIGILVLLAGCVYGSMAGFKSYVEGIKGTTITYDQVRQHMRTVPRFEPAIPHDWQLKIAKFRVDYGPQHMPKQYYSTLTLLPAGQAPSEETIWVNRPLDFMGMTFYQANWGLAGLHLRIDGKHQALSVSQMREGNGWVARWPEQGQPRYLFMVERADAPLQVFAHGTEQFTPLAQGGSVKLQGHSFTYDAPILMTGLEVGYDPGYPIVVLSFIIITVGVLLAWLPHRQVWLQLPAPGIDRDAWLAGRAPRAQLTLDADLAAILADWPVYRPQPLPPAVAMPAVSVAQVAPAIVPEELPEALMGATFE